MNNLSKNIAIWLIIAVVLMTVFNQFGAQRTAQTQVPYSQFIDEVRENYDYVIIDSPPVLLVPDARIIGKLVDAVAANVYASAYNKNSEFFVFMRSLQAYRESFSSREDVMVVEPDGDFFRYLKDRKGEN